jgi:ABC-2 type transport system ATP-binding protein
MLQRLYVHNFRCLENFQLDLKDIPSALLIGKNGAGKSTTLQILSYLIRPNKGFIQINGWDYYTESFQAKCSLGIVPQEFNFNTFDLICVCVLSLRFTIHNLGFMI